MGGNFKFQVQDSFLEYFFFEIWRSKKQIALSEKKPPLILPKVKKTISLMSRFLRVFLEFANQLFSDYFS